MKNNTHQLCDKVCSVLVRVIPSVIQQHSNALLGIDAASNILLLTSVCKACVLITVVRVDMITQ